MIHALSEAGLRALCDAASQPLLYAFDFDGTLAPISRDRHAVTVSDSTLQLLGELAKRAPCAIVTRCAVTPLHRSAAFSHRSDPQRTEKRTPSALHSLRPCRIDGLSRLDGYFLPIRPLGSR